MAFSGGITRELPVDLVFDVGHGDERCNNTAPATGLDCPHISTQYMQSFSLKFVLTTCGDLAVVYVPSRTETSAAVGLGQEQSQLATRAVCIDDRAFVDGPVVRGCVATEVRRVRKDTREIGERVLLCRQFIW